MKHSCRVLIAVLALSVLWCTFGLFAIADSSLKLPPNLTTIEAEAFCGSKAIGKVVLPNSVEAIYARAFADSTISEINLPKSLTYIDDTAFENVNNLIVTADSGTYAYDWAVENGYLTDLSQIDKLQFTELTTNSALILKTTTNYDFSSGDLKFGTQSLIPARLALPAQKMKFIAYALNEEPDFSDLKQDSRKVGAYLFNDNLSYRLLLQGNLNGAPLFTIKSAAVGRAKYVKVMIGLYADRKDAKPSAWTGVGFAIAEAEHPHEADHPHEASPVEDFVIQGGVITKYIGEGGDVVIPSKDAKGKKITKIGEDAFWPDEEEEYEKTGRANVDSVVIPEGVTSIAGCAFNRSSLSSITIPNSVKEIGEAAFRGCGFASIVLPNGLTSIRESTFSDCSSLVDISIPKSVTRIQDNAFNGCISLTDINIPDSVKNIGLGAFKDCTSLTSMVLPRMLTGISDSTFMNCTSLTHVVIPDGVASIGSYAFGSAYSLEHISIPSSVTVIGDCAFSDCHSITSINIPNSVTSIGGYAFEDCHSLSSISLSNKITIIAKGTFDGCHSLKSLSIPNGVTTIREAFYGCDRLEQLYIPASVTNIDGDEYWYASSIFNDCSNLTIYCSDDSAAETYANYYDIKYKHGSFSAHSITDITITHDLQGSVLAKGSATGSFKMSPAAKPGATSTLKISCDADWDVALNNVEWMTAEKQGDNRVLLTVGDVEDGKYYSSILTFVVNGTDTYTVTVIMDRTSLSPEPEPTVNVGKPVIKDLTTGKTFEGGKTVSYDTSNGALSLKLSAENGCGQYKIVVIALNEAPDFSDENQAARRIKTVFTDGDGYAYNDVWSKQVYEEMIKLCKGIPISLAGLSNGQYLKIAVGAYARENDAEPKVWTNIGLKIIRNENEVKLLSKTEFMKKVASLAVADYPNSKILPSVVIAQTIVETGWGQTEIMMKHNALFAVKADSSWKGGFYSAKTKEYYKEWTTITALFRAYSSWEDCIADHTKVLSLKRYNGVVGGTDYKSVCKILQNGGYATAPNYASALINIIEENKLYEYDKVTTYNAKAAVDYAKKHWNDTCKISDHARNDCAHFVAQCLDAGGIVIPDESYKNRFSETTANARTWCPSQASYLNDKVSNIKREFENSDVDPGDIVYATWGDGIQHVYICIAKNKNDATLCAHTNNTCTETISNLRKKHYLWGLVDLVHTGH